MLVVVLGCQECDWEVNDSGPHQALAPQDERVKALCELMRWMSMIIGETSGMEAGRAATLAEGTQPGDDT